VGEAIRPLGADDRKVRRRLCRTSAAEWCVHLCIHSYFSKHSLCCSSAPRPHHPPLTSANVCAQNDRYMHPRPGSSSSTRRSKQRPASASPNAASLSHLPPRGNSASPNAGVQGRVEHRHPGFYGPGPSGGVDLQTSVDQMNSSDANVDQLISGLEQLKGKR
jgi:hypothetical protein